MTTLCGAAVVLGYWRLVGFSTFTSDPRTYWSDSVHWREPFNQFHMPGYPLLIAAIRAATGGVLGQVGLMTTVAVAALLVGVHATYTLASLTGLSRRASLTAASAFGLWPFVGVTYAAFPVSDPLALALLLWGTIFYLRERPALAGLLLGLTAVTHKGLWPAIALLILGQVLSERRRRAALTMALLVAAPLCALWLDAVTSGQPTSWLLSASAKDAARPTKHGSLHMLDGLIGSVVYGGWISRARVVVVIAIVALAVVLLAIHVRWWREPLHRVAAVFAAQIIFMALTLNQHLIWASVRFSGLLAVPTAWAASRTIDSCSTSRWRYLTMAIVVLLIITQLVTAAEGARRHWGGTL